MNKLEMMEVDLISGIKKDFEATPDDWDLLAYLLDKEQNILFSYTWDRINVMAININQSFTAYGTLTSSGCTRVSIVGNPRGRVWISVDTPFAFQFDINHEQYPNYLMEKLDLPHDTAVAFSQLLNELRKRRNGLV